MPWSVAEPMANAASSTRDLPDVADRLVVASLAVLVAVTFANGLHGGMVLDNDPIVVQDPRVRRLGWDNLWLIFTQDYWYPSGVGRLYRPLTTLSYALNHALFGPDPLGYHVVNVALHAVVAGLVYRLMRRVLVERWAAAAVAALFAVHPVVVESVTNVVGRADLLAAIAVLSALLVHARNGRRGGRHAGVLAGITLLGALCKENVLALGLLLPAYDLAFRHAHTARGWWRDVVATVRARTAYAWAGVVPVTLAILGLRTWLFARWPLTPLAVVDNPLRAAPFVAREVTAVSVVGRYVGLILAPTTLSCDYSFAEIPVAGWPLSGVHVRSLALVGAAALAWLWAWRACGRPRALLFLVAFSGVTLLPSSNLVVLIDSIMAERFLYLPLIGALGCAILGLGRLVRPLAARGTVVALAIALLAARTTARNRDWRDDLALWTSARAAAPGSSRAHRNLGWAMFRADETLAHGAGPILDELAQATTILEPLPRVDRDKVAYLFLGVVARTEGDRLARAQDDRAAAVYARALGALEEARAIDRAQNERHRAREVARGGSVATPDVGQPRIYRELGDVLSATGRPEDALDAYRWLRHLSPEDELAHRRLLAAERALGRRDDAAVTLLEALLLGQRGPDLAGAIMDLFAGIRCGDASAVTGGGDDFALDLDCPPVHAQLCAAARGLVDALAPWPARADWARDVVREHACDGTAPRS